MSKTTEEKPVERKQLSIKVDMVDYDALWKITRQRESSTRKVSINDVVNEAIKNFISQESNTPEKSVV